ncbi:MAG: excinuclease ABC subunit UvrC [Steroidobacteraceae bacterium]|nr:excinuclease ABC subunit UvrC [Steroidobacteraceae bacterium]MDW8260216.1 excinuclease ABC subunit UvrC [Gammaproteobacteria bacterium]
MSTAPPRREPPFDSATFVASLPRKPGVYRMYDARGNVLYVGKARHLRERLASYFVPSHLHPKVQAMVAQVANIEITITRSETEALLLEYNLIKELKPRYNVLLRDDKSFPYIRLDSAHEFPRLSYYRGPRVQPARYFGPFPHAHGVREVLQHIQKVFRIRNCRDSFFAHRSRPCLQHQIGRCSAPCVGLIDRDSYAADVAAAVRVLEGRNHEVLEDLALRMERAAAALDFETAARFRDQLAALKSIQAQQIVAAASDRDADLFAICGEVGDYVITVMHVRGGRMLGTSQRRLRTMADSDAALANFILQFYTTAAPPREILTSIELADAAALAAAITAQQRDAAVVVRRPRRGIAARWLALAVENAAQALRMRAARGTESTAQRAALGALLGLEQPPARIECFDISHTQGEGTIAACVVFGADGPAKSEYRRFNITGVAPGDDYAALSQALTRRYARIEAGEVPMPQVLLIDGGAGQLACAKAALARFGLAAPRLAAVAKGPDRRAGQERLYLPESAAPILLAGHAALPLIQRIRDEAHRFAIAGHRRKRARRFNASILEAVPGLGPVKRREILKHFGGLQGVLRAGVDDFRAVPGIGPVLAQAIYDQMHPGD